MLQAFDTIMRCAVNAQEVAKNNIDEPFRYECLCCGEEVHIAAANSTLKSPHFRHLRGNSDRDCELYLGSIGIEGAITAAKKRAHERAEILFDTELKVFSLLISFPQEKIDEYERKGCTLEILSGQRNVKKETIRISRTNFSPDSPIEFPLNYSSSGCFIAINGVGIKAHYDILKPIDFPTFFKIKAASSYMGKAKRHTDGIIYTGFSYYVIADKRSSIEKLYHYNSISVSGIDEIQTTEGSIWGTQIVINSILDYHLSNILAFCGYTLKKSESVTLLWPPSYTVDDTICCSSSKAILFSSFELRAKSNISCDLYALEKKNNLFFLTVLESINIRYENVEMQVSPGQDVVVSNRTPIPTFVQTTVNVPENEDFYIIDKNIISKLSPGRHYLREYTKIVHYNHNYPCAIYIPKEKERTSTVGKLRDILQYYKVTIPFTEDLIDDIQVSKLAETYLENCRITGNINPRALEYIKAGVL